MPCFALLSPRSRFALVLAAAALAPCAGAQSILSNITGSDTLATGSQIGVIGNNATQLKAVGLTTGATPLPLVSMRVLMGYYIANSPLASITGGVYSNVGTGPGTLLASLGTKNVAYPGPDLYELTPLSPFTLAPSTTYWFVISSSTPDLTFMDWRRLDPNTAPAAAGGVTYQGYRISTDSGTSWNTSGIFNAVDIRVQGVPEPTTLAGMAMAGVVLLRRRRPRA